MTWHLLYITYKTGIDSENWSENIVRNIVKWELEN